MLLLDTLFREQFLLGLGVLEVRQDYQTSAYPGITATDEHRRLFGYLLTDPSNSCRVVFCCLRHGFQVQATRVIEMGECATFYDGIRGHVPQFTGTSTPSSMFAYSNSDWQTKIGSYTHILSLGQGELALDGKWLPPTTAVGFGSFCNASTVANIQFYNGNITDQNGLKYFVARAVAQQRILKDQFLKVDYTRSLKSFQAVNMTDFMALDSFNTSLKNFFETSHATINAQFQCQDQDEQDEGNDAMDFADPEAQDEGDEEMDFDDQEEQDEGDSDDE
jgi:hypothetical protein